jgi:hypothetical protein
MRRLIALLPILIMVAACDQGPQGVAVKTSHIAGDDLTTEVEFQTADPTDPSLVKSMAGAIGSVAKRVQSGEVKLATDAGMAEFQFVATNARQTRLWYLLTVRVPVAALKSAAKPQNDTGYLELATAVTPGAGPKALSAAFDYCDTRASVSPKFCQLVGNYRAGGD